MQKKFLKTKCMNKLSSFILCMALIVAMALMATGCNDSSKQDAQAEIMPAAESGTPETQSSAEPDTAETQSDTEANTAEAGAAVLGEGQTSFSLTVTGTDGKNTAFEIRTDKDTVGAALLELGVIAGEDSEYGLYVNTVNGITVDYDKDGKYWAFYVDGEYAAAGVDSTPITEGSAYSFKVE